MTRSVERKRLTLLLERCARQSVTDSDSVAAWRSQLRNYRDLLDHKRTVFGSNTVEALQHNPRCMWRDIEDLFGRVECVTRKTSLTADNFFQLFHAKFSGVSAPLPLLCQAVDTNGSLRSAKKIS